MDDGGAHVGGSVRLEGDGSAPPLSDNVTGELRLFAAATGGTVVLFGWSGDRVACLLRQDPPAQPLVIPPFDCGALLPGTEAPLHVLLAWLRPDVLDRRVAGLQCVPHSVRDRALLALRLMRVRATGRDIVAGGVSGEVTSIAVPVRDRSGQVAAALALVAPSVYLEDLDLGMVATDLCRTAGHLADGEGTVLAPA
jgi:DNA-binding IclR family transcriptional regulator